MVETSKQVRVDNWGIYFLQRLQLFFSKTDYCDLTLQFEGNVQLKVHRLVMNACTEYFAFLEQTCPALEENTIMMPADLQADVIVPIVNFMYTGMLEFHPSIYDKLYRAAETMNMAVLTKLLEAQLAPINKLTSRSKRDSWKDVRKPSKPALPLANELPAPLPGKKVPVWKKRIPPSVSPQSHPVSATFTSHKWASDPIEKDPLSVPDNAPKPTRFEWPEDDLTPISGMYPSFDDVSLTSKPLWTKEDDQKASPTEEPPKQYPSRRNSSSVSQDVDDEFTEKEQKVNVSQNENSPVSNDSFGAKRKPENKITSSPKRIKISNQDEETVISITTSNPSEVDHTKIVSEILKKYPDLVKKKKNIKLKITQSKPEPQQAVKVQTVREKAKSQLASPVEKPQSMTTKEIKREPPVVKEPQPLKETVPNKRWSKKNIFRAASEEGPWTCMECFGQDREGSEFVLYYLFRKHMADQHQVEFDSSLCKYCGKKCLKETFMTYHLYTKHGLKPSRNVVFPKCNVCPFIAVTTDRLQEHLKTHGKYEAQCLTCHLGFLTKRDLLGHQQIAGHNNKASAILDCAYCMKKLQSPVTLFTHVRAQHIKEARRDGVASLDEIMDIQSDDTEDEMSEKEVVTPQPETNSTETVEGKVEEKPLLKDRVNIISNVKVARPEETIAEDTVHKVLDPPRLQEPEAQPVAITTAASALSNIGGSLATNLGLVDIVVLDDNQQYILQQPQGQPGNAEFILPPELTSGDGILQAAAAAATGELNSTDELVMVLTDHDYQDEQNQGQTDNSNIVVLYSHPVEGQQGQFITSQGNILVNSEGMLEIRNGAAITTTAGQIIVNNDNTTTTQATESPIESIDLIRKEIEGSEDIVSGRQNIKNVLRKKVNIETRIVPSTPVETNEDQTEDNTVSYEDTKKDVDSLDTTDSSVQDEAMEVDEIGPQCGVVEAAGQDNQPAPDAERPDGIEKPNNEIISEEAEGEDVPPDTDRIERGNSVTQLDSELVLNNQEHNNYAEALQEEEHMEVDGAKLSESAETEPSENTPIETCTHLDENTEQEPQDPSPEAQPQIADVNEVNEAKESCLENGQSIENDVNDSNDNVQPNYDDFTDESQQSSGQKSHKDLNKEILDDWDDTDSQQSHSQEADSQEQEDEAAALHAAENVTKLMDDWDDEDEDQTKG